MNQEAFKIAVEKELENVFGYYPEPSVAPPRIWTKQQIGDTLFIVFSVGVLVIFVGILEKVVGLRVSKIVIGMTDLWASYLVVVIGFFGFLLFSLSYILFLLCQITGKCLIY